MPDKDKHLQGAGENEKFAEHIIGTNFRRWGVVGYFYCALHMIDAHLANRGIHPTGHKNRETHINKDALLSGLYTKYRHLKQASMDARYCLYEHNSSEIERLKIECLKEIKSALRGI